MALHGAIVLLRHGESTWIAEGRFQGQADPPLSAAGRRQAELAAARLADPRRQPALPIPLGPPGEIVHSPLSRTTETAALVAAAIPAPGAPIPLRPEPGLLEIGQGEWEGLPGAEIEGRWPDVLAGWRRDPLTSWAPGGESVAEVDVRVRSALRGVLARMADRSEAAPAFRSHVLGYDNSTSTDPWTLLVAHDGVFKVVLLALLDLPLARFWSFPFALCGISVIEFRAGRPRLRAHNLIDHLAPLDDAATRAEEAARTASGAL
ncbi:MAG: histidine phosphatase family protein [Chloroflexi bacterium]|nr:histidine phosphatase family protein [Chloroflexota bacterium]